MSRNRSLEETRITRRAQVEQLLASDLSVRRWCELNRVKPSTMYDWIRYFRDNDPDVFGGYEIAHAGDGERHWLKRVREAMRDSKAIQPAFTAPAGYKAPASFAIVDAADLRAPAPTPQPAANGPHCVTVRAGGVEIEIPLAAGEAAVASLVRAVMAS